MKKLYVVASLMVLLHVNLFGQWYVDKYNVTNINDLSKEQLDESLKGSKTGLLTSAGVAGFGGLLYVIFRYAPPASDEDSSFLREILGDDRSDKALMITGAGVFIGGSVASVAYLGRTLRIKSVINNNYPYDGVLSISPAMITSSYSLNYYPGVTFTYKF